MRDVSQVSAVHITSDHTGNPAILDQITLRPNAHVQGTTMDSETVLLDLNTGRYYTLNSLGSVIWDLCTGHNTINDMHAVLCDRFEVAPEQALDDLVTLVNQLVQEGLLQPGRKGNEAA